MRKLLLFLLEILRSIKNIPTKIKKLYKKEKFKKFAKTGKNLVISHRSDCVAEKPGYIEVGDNCEILGRLESQGEGKISIGNNCAIFQRSVIGSVENIKIGNCVFISNHVHIYDNNNHPTDPVIRRQMCMNGYTGDAWRWTHAESKPIVIEDNVWIGEYSAIFKGVTIGEGSIVAAHAVVTKNVPPYSMVAGNPAKVVKELPHE